MNIYASIAAIQADVEFIAKDKQVKEGGSYRYRGVDQVLNTLHPLFAKYRVFAVPEVLEVLFREDRSTNSGKKVLYEVLRVAYHFYAEDGTSVSAVVIGEAMDSGDKVSNKCMSVAYKYACFQLLSIPTEETTQDPDDANETLDRTGTTQIIEREDFKNQLTSIGITDSEKTVKWFEKQYKKPLIEFSEEELAECIAWSQGRVEKKKREEEERVL